MIYPKMSTNVGRKNLPEPDPERARLYGDHVMAFYVKADADNRIATKNGIQRDYTVMKKTVMCLYICPIR